MKQFPSSCVILAALFLNLAGADGSRAAESKVLPFGKDGKFKMLYDARQRPQSVYLRDRLYLVYNGEASPTSNDKGKAHPMLITYDPGTRTFSKAQRLGPKESDHHFSPIIWADRSDHLHVLHGCHRTPGVHLISKTPIQPGQDSVEWSDAPQIAPKLSYPTVFRVAEERDLIYYRTEGHTSSWTYRLSQNNGHSWIGPANDVTDLDLNGALDWSSYQTKLPSQDGRFLHVVYTDYDDNKTSPDPQRFFNPFYNQLASNEWKYNLSYLKIDLQTQQVFNHAGTPVETPIDLKTSRENCQIWDTEWRGAGVPPAVSLNGKGEPCFLHVLSADSLRSHHYYYVRRKGGQWIQTRICPSNHQWNSCHLRHDKDGLIHAYLVAGEGYLEGGYMNRHGGGRIEEWTSSDGGDTWEKARVIQPDSERFKGWRFNNVQPVVRPDGSEVENMLLFYGWHDEDLPEARAFLLHE